MDEMLQALGYAPVATHRLCFLSVFTVSVLGWATSEQLLALLVGNAVLVQLAGWSLWFIWQGWLFARRRQRYLATYSAQAYRRAFFADILPGTTFGLAQMLAPLANGVFFAATLNHEWLLAAALLMLVAGVTLLILGFRTIGIAGASFLYEYQPQPPKLIRESIYSCIRHPLFLGGVIASVGLGLSFAATTTIALAAVNIAILPIYHWLEDRRLIGVLGAEYATYCMQVGGIIPKPQRWVRLAVTARLALRQRRHHR